MRLHIGQDPILPLQYILGTIHTLRHHIFGIFGPPPPLRQHVFSTKNKQKFAFSDPPSPPPSADVIYEWSLTKPLVTRPQPEILSIVNSGQNRPANFSPTLKSSKLRPPPSNKVESSDPQEIVNSVKIFPEVSRNL